MTITFAGIPLLLEDPEGRAGKFVERYMEWPRSTVNAPARVIDPKSRVQRPRWPLMPNLRPNQLYIPTGATRWGQFIGLTDKATKDAILASLVRGNGALRMSLDDGVTVPVSPTGNTIDGARFDLQNRIDTEMLLLPPVPVNDQSDGLWILPMVDARYQWQTRSFISTATTWAGLLGEISTSLGLTTTFKRDDSADVNAEYGIPDACIFRNGLINTAAALDLYCWATNQRLCPVNRQWNPGTAYVVNDVVVNGGLFYTCTVAGNSAATGPGPVGLSPGADGTVTWVGSICASPTYVLRSNTTSSDLYTKQVAAQNSTYNSGQFSAGSPFDKSKSKDVPAAIKFHFTNDGATDRYAFSATSYPSWATGSTLDVMCPATFTGSNSTALLTVADRWANYFWQWTEHRFNWSFNRMLAWSLTGYEDYVLLDQSRTRRGNYNCRTFVKSLPATGWGMDVVPIQLSTGGNECSGSGGSSGGGGTGGGGCSCCDCTDCLNMCAQAPNKVISTCESCGVAPRRYTINLGTTLGSQNFSYVAGCVWRSAEFDTNYLYPTGIVGPDTGTYKATLTQDGANSTLIVEYVSGVDVLKLGSGYRELAWTADPNREWSCICNSTMIPSVSPERFPPNLYAPCEVCVAPVAETGGADEWTICHVDAGCVASLTLPEFESLTMDDPNSVDANWIASIAKPDPDSCCFTTLTNGDGLESCPSGVTCWNKFIDNFPDPSFWWGGSACVNADGSGGWKIVVTLTVGTGASTPEELEWGNAVYEINVADLVSGTNTLTLLSSTGHLTWPATYDIEVDDCTFGASDYDYGYGCGYGDGTGGGGGGGGDEPCSGSCVFEWSEAGSAWSLVSAMSNCVGSGCSCHEPGISGGYDGQLTSGSCST